MGDVRTHNSRTDSLRIFKLGGGVDHMNRHVLPLTKVKRSKVSVTRPRNVSAAIATDDRISLKLGGNFHREGRNT